MTDKHLTDTRFKDLDIHPSVLQGIETAGFEFCTPIQALSLPLALQGKDISGQAQTGTGKTAAFLIACMHRLLTNEAKSSSSKNPIRGLILAPTRELAIQIMDDSIPLAQHTGLKLGIAYGGTDYDKQRKNIEQGLDILIGTPGRIIDYFKQNIFALDALEVIVLDEADRMFDLGFIADIRFLFRRMPEPAQRLNLLFSATLSLRVAELAYEHMSEPEVVKIEAETITANRIQEIAYMPSNEEKIPLLLGLIERTNEQKTVIFINTKHQAEKIEAWLSANNFKVAMLSGDVPQKKRETLLNKFKQGKCNILVATDVAARGLHIPSVNYVINFDLPNDAEDYVHRIGRTARAGESGIAISLICETFAMNIVDIEEFIEHSIPVERNITELLFTSPNKPDLSALRSNKKSKKEPRSKPNTKPNKASKPTQRGKSKINNTQIQQPDVQDFNEPTDSIDADAVVDITERILDKEFSADAPKANYRRIILRSQRGQEVPAVG